MDPRSLLVFLLPLLRGIAAGGGGDVLAAIGSSVLLDPDHGANLSDSQIEWTFNNSNGKLVTILDYVPNSPIQKPNTHFKSRLRFNASSGSVTIDNLKPSDQGVYTITVADDWKRSMDLKLIEPLSEPSIAYNSTCVDTAVQLTCHMSGGKEYSVLWWKDNRMLTRSQHYQLVRNNSTLIISEAKISDCGTYTCAVENPVSQKNTSYSLKLHGLTHLLRCMLVFSVVALITAAVTLVATVITLVAAIVIYLGETSYVNKDGKARLQFIQEKMQRFLKFASVFSFLFFFIACVCWMLTEVCEDMPHRVTSVHRIIADAIPIVNAIAPAGPSGITGIVFILLFLHLIIIALSNSCMIWDRQILNKIISYKFCHVTLNVAAPVITTCGSCILIREVIKQHGENCESTANLLSIIIPTAVMVILVLAVTTELHKIYIDWKQQQTGTPATSASVRDPDQCQ